MDIIHILILAIIQGITEFLPVSSSAHLIIIPKIFNWPDQGLSFDIAVHLGTLTAVLIYFRKDIFKLSNPFYHLTQKLIVATIPVCIVGLFAANYIEQYLRDSPLVIAFSTIIFGLLMGLAEYQAQYKTKNKISNINNISFNYSLLIGLAQCAALIPGASRLGSTMTMALLLGSSRIIAAEFSFLMSIPVILLSSALLIKKIIFNPSLINLDLYHYLIGFIVSGVVGTLTIYTLIRLIEKIGLMPFVIYRLLLGCVILYYFL